MANMARRRKRSAKPESAADTEIKPADHEKKLTIRIPEQLHHNFRLVCFNQGISMTQTLNEILETYIDTNRKYLL